MGLKFVYEGHWVKVKVTGATKKVENSHSRNEKLPSTITPVLKQSCDVCMQHGVFGYVGSIFVTAIFVT